MKIIKLNAINSTNEYIKQLLKKKSIKENLAVYTYNQTEGKGQRGKTWSSEPGKNLAFSICLFTPKLKLQNQFLVNVLVSLFIIEFLEFFKIPDLTVKWPNDIMSGKKKICGILNEIKFKRNKIVNIIIGFGININQEKFQNLPNASSLKLITQNSFDLNRFSSLLKEKLKKNNFFISKLLNIENLSQEKYIENYNEKLFGKKNLMSFVLIDGKKIVGKIISVNPDGILNIKIKNGDLISFRNNEIQIIV